MNALALDTCPSDKVLMKASEDLKEENPEFDAVRDHCKRCRNCGKKLEDNVEDLLSTDPWPWSYPNG